MQRPLLGRNRELRFLVGSRFVSSAGTWLAYLALTVDVYARTRSSLWVSAVLLADFLPSLAVGTLLGPWLDRLPRRTLLVAAELTAGTAFAALPFAPNALAVLGLALVAGTGSAFLFPTLRATIPALVDADDLPRANALSQTAGTSGLAAGPVLAGVIVTASGVDLVYLLNAASFAISALLLSRLPRLARGPAEAEDGSYWSTAAAGLATMFRGATRLRQIVLASALAALGGAVVNVGEIFLARDTFHAGTVGFGLLASASGTGIVLGSRLAGRITAASGLRSARGALALCAAGFGAAALAPDIWAAAPCALAGGIGSAFFLAASTLVVQTETDDATRGHAFAILDAVSTVALGAGMAGGGALLAVVDARGAWLLAAGIVALAAVATLARGAAAARLRPETAS